MKRLGPELKLPKLGSSSLKAPPVVADVYHDLRDRRLLPLVALVVVAILAVPFLLAESQEPASDPGLGSVESSGGPVAGDSGLTVVRSTPGLRDYRKRLKGRTPTDPFVQKYTGVPATSQLKSVGSEGKAADGGSSAGSAAAPADSGGGSSVAGSPPSVDASPAGDGGSSTGSGGGGSGGGPPATSGDDLDEDRLFAYRPDVRFGVAGSGELRRHEDLPLASLLPKENPVVIFIGATEGGGRAVFDVSADVALVRGEGKCVGGRQSCELLFMAVGDAATLQTASGPGFRLAVDSIDLVPVDGPKSAGASAAGVPGVPGFSQNFSK
jgi:hypothetical protein